MRRPGRLLAFPWVVSLLFTGPVLAQDEADPPPPLGTRVAGLDDLRVVERVIEGELLRAAVLPDRLGRGLAVLVKTPGGSHDRSHDSGSLDSGSLDSGPLDSGSQVRDAPRQLWALDADPEAPPRLLADGLPSSFGDLHRHGDELWLGGDGVIHRLEGAGTDGAEARPILASPGLELELLAVNGLLELPGGGVAVPELGRLLLYDAALEQVAVLPVPLRAERRRHGLVLASPSVVRPAGSRRAVFYAGPEERPGHRLRIGLLEPGEKGGDAEADPEEAAAWVRLPGAEEVVSSRFLLVDGEPRLALTTMEAGTVGLFAEQRLRLYALRRDRTRGGLGPLLAVDTVSKRWHAVGLDAVDADGDGDDDLVVLQPEGLAGGDLVVQIYRGLGSGTISIARPRRSKLDVEPGSGTVSIADPGRSVLDARPGGVLWSDDLDGDGLPDLLLASRSDGLRLLPGTDHPRRAVDDDPRWVLHADELRGAMVSQEGEAGPFPHGHFSRLGRIRIHHLDGDSLPEISLIWGEGGRTVVRYVLPR